MKTLLYLSTFLFLVSTAFSSCADNDYQPVSIESKWLTQRRILITNKPAFDKIINAYFKQDELVYTIERTFSKKKIDTDITAEVQVAAIPKQGQTGSERLKIGTYQISKDSLYLRFPAGNENTKQYFLLTRTDLITHQRVTKTELTTLLALELHFLTPDQIPSDIEGELITYELK